MDSARILIVDDHPIIRSSLRVLLSSQPDWTTCGEAVDGLNAIEKAESLRFAYIADYTAMHELVQTRFGLTSMTARDAAKIDMTEFFDFAYPPWMTPPAPPTQSTSGLCYRDHVPGSKSY
jgi:CheY-like chemotaxis protein